MCDRDLIDQLKFAENGVEAISDRPVGSVPKRLKSNERMYADARTIGADVRAWLGSPDRSKRTDCPNTAGVRSKSGDIGSARLTTLDLSDDAIWLSINEPELSTDTMGPAKP